MDDDGIRQLIALWQRRLGLDRWEIELDLEKPSQQCGDDWAHASLWRSDNYETGTIYLHPDWRGWKPAEAGQHVVHELVHAMLRDVEQTLVLVDELDASYGSRRVVRAAFEQRIEAAVDLISRRAIAIANGAG